MARNFNVRIRFTEEEFQHLKECCDKEEENAKYVFRTGKKNFSSYLRDRIFSNTDFFQHRFLQQTEKKLLYEIRKIGVNINQIAKKINSGYAVPSDMERLEAHLSEIENLMGEIVGERKKWESQN